MPPKAKSKDQKLSLPLSATRGGGAGTQRQAKSLSGTPPASPMASQPSSPSQKDNASPISVTPSGDLPAMITSHRNCNACPCKQSTGDWLIDCSSCSQFWHADCVGLKGLDEKEINKLLYWKCPFCYKPPFPTSDTNSDVDVCHICRNTVVLQKTNNLFELALADENSKKVQAIVDSATTALSEAYTAQINTLVESSTKAMEQSKNLISSLSGQLDDLSEKLSKTSNNFKTERNGNVNVPPACPNVTAEIPPSDELPFEDYKNDFLDDSEAVSILQFLEECRTNGAFKQKNGRGTLGFGVQCAWTSIYNEQSGEKDIPDALLPMVNKSKEACGGQELNCLLINYYPAKSDSQDPPSHMPAHSDDEFDIVPDSLIATYSLGASRTINFTPKHSDEDHSIDVDGNSLYIMSRRSQEYYKHSMLDVDVTAVRYSVTMRHVDTSFNRSTLIIGDSNTQDIVFGEGRGTMGERYPGKRVKAAKIGDVEPGMCGQYANIVIAAGTNDLWPKNRPDVDELVDTMVGKVSQIAQLNPKAHVFVMPVLPTRDREMNRLVMDYNRRLLSWVNRRFHRHVTMPSVASFLDSTGLLSLSLARNSSDKVHLGKRGISKYVSVVKNSIFDMIKQGDQRQVSKTSRSGPKKPG